MPRLNRRLKRKREYTANERKLLLDGVSMPTDWGHIHRGRFDYAAAKAAWRELESELLPVWIAEHPFTRPWAWLVFDAKEPRIRTVGEQRIESMEEVKARGWLRGSFRLCYFQDLNKRLGAEETRGNEGEWETEKQYLARIGALTAEELALL